MNVKAVIDTNVLVSAYWTRNSDSPPARVYRALFSGRWGPTSSAARNRDQTQIALRGGCGRPGTSAPTGGIEGLWGKDIGPFIRRSSDALLLRCSDAEVGQDRASGVD